MNISEIIKRIVPKNIAGMLGVLGVLIPLVKEFVIAGMRITAIFLPRVEVYIPKVAAVFQKIEKVWDNIKRFFLDMEPESLSGGDSPSG